MVTIQVYPVLPGETKPSVDNQQHAFILRSKPLKQPHWNALEIMSFNPIETCKDDLWGRHNIKFIPAYSWDHSFIWLENQHIVKKAKRQQMACIEFIFFYTKRSQSHVLEIHGGDSVATVFPRGQRQEARVKHKTSVCYVSVWCWRSHTVTTDQFLTR